MLAIDDNDNDIESFSGADISIAVANSSSLALDHADYVYDNKSVLGFYDMLHVLEAAKKYY
ncbi:MAG: HAD hydrolase family protein [Lachnospira sp.]|nr:HAD hydrolase family protein [Lachnospira sp.]